MNEQYIHLDMDGNEAAYETSGNVHYIVEGTAFLAAKAFKDLQERGVVIDKNIDNFLGLIKTCYEDFVPKAEATDASSN